MIIYKATNVCNGKVYIGQTIRPLEKRRSQHLANARKGIVTKFYNAIRKYGADNFLFDIVCTASSVEELNVLELYYIQKYDSVRCGYNMVDGGKNNVMFLPSVRKKHSERLKEQSVRDQIPVGMQEYRNAHPFTDEHRKKLSAAALGNHNFGTSDTRSIACWCEDADGKVHHFHSYRDAYIWWKSVDNPFTSDAECIYQRKIKQSIQGGFYTYKGNQFNVPVWHRTEVIT